MQKPEKEKSGRVRKAVRTVILLAAAVTLFCVFWPEKVQTLRDSVGEKVNLTAAAECFGRGLHGEGLEAFRQGFRYAFVPDWSEAEEAWAIAEPE